jgi:hypothetical protein
MTLESDHNCGSINKVEENPNDSFLRSKSKYPIRVYGLNDDFDFTPWTTAKLIDELFLNLIEIRARSDKKGYVSKYRHEAERCIYRIPLDSPRSIFIIEFDDLTDRVKLELGLVSDKSLRHHVMMEAISRIFEEVEINGTGIDRRYFRLSVRKLLKWKVV